ncbi:MAG TPA: alpha/beta hydrolase, partial [Pyrinomonadaceae bacterium]|nr:alpha/beta hydrolase [Pyrinomonadaceae bacterium]
LYFETHGGGTPLVLVPGFASGAWSWNWQADELSSDFQVITFDPRGVSRSTLHGGKAVSIQSIADDAAELMDWLEIDAAHVLGISFGGFVAQEFALKYPMRLKKLVLASTSFGGPNHVAPSMEVLAAFASTEGLNTSERIRQYLTMAFSSGFLESDRDTVDQFCTLREDNPVPRDVYMQQLQSAMMFNAEDRIAAIAAETLVITGDNDTVVPVQNSSNLAAKIPNARLAIIENSGHMAFVERAAEFNRMVRDFLKGSMSGIVDSE